MCSLVVVNAQAYLEWEEQLRKTAHGVTEISGLSDCVIAARRSPCRLKQR